MSFPAYAIVDSGGNVVGLTDVTPSAPGITATAVVTPPTGHTLVPTNGVLVMIGSTYKSGVGFTAPPAPAPTTAQLQAAVDQERDSLLAAGFNDNGTGATGKVWQCDQESRGLLTALGASAYSVITQSPAVNFTLIAADNTTVTLTAANVYALINGRIMPWVSNMFMYGRTLKNLYAQGTPPSSITVGWPTK